MRQLYQPITENCFFSNLNNVPLLCQLVLKDEMPSNNDDTLPRSLDHSPVESVR